MSVTRRTRLQTPFGDYLDKLLNVQGYSIRSFARKVGIAQPNITKFKRIGLPPKRIEQWADLLRLTGTQRDRFIYLAWLDHTPSAVKERLGQLEAELARLAQKDKKD